MCVLICDSDINFNLFRKVQCPRRCIFNRCHNFLSAKITDVNTEMFSYKSIKPYIRLISLFAIVMKSRNNVILNYNNYNVVFPDPLYINIDPSQRERAINNVHQWKVLLGNHRHPNLGLHCRRLIASEITIIDMCVGALANNVITSISITIDPAKVSGEKRMEIWSVLLPFSLCRCLSRGS